MEDEENKEARRTSRRQGIQGEQGPAGPKQEVQLSTHFPSAVSVTAGEFRNVFATCPSGEVATGGGLFYNGGNPTALISRNSGISTGGLNPTSWEETLFNPGPTSINIQPSVVCAKLVDAP